MHRTDDITDHNDTVEDDPDRRDGCPELCLIRQTLCQIRDDKRSAADKDAMDKTGRQQAAIHPDIIPADVLFFLPSSFAKQAITGNHAHTKMPRRI
jgi:hypothetical protein